MRPPSTSASDPVRYPLSPPRAERHHPGPSVRSDDPAGDGEPPALLSVGASSARLGLVSVAGLLTGLIREGAIAYRFGPGPTYDAFLLASLPFDLLSVVAAVQMSAVQRAVSEREHQLHRGAAYALWAGVTRTLAGAFLVLGVVGALAGPAVVAIAMRSLGYVERQEVSLLLLWMIPAPALAAWMAMQSAALNSRHRFAALPLTGITANLSLAVGALALGSRLHGEALVVGTVGGLMIGIALQALLSRRAGFVPTTGGALEPGVVTHFFQGSWPLVALALLNRLYIVIERLLASGLPSGTISSLAFATRFAAIPVAVLSSVGTPLFTLLVGHAIRGNLSEFARAGERGIRLSLFLVTPAIVFLVLFADAVVRVLLQRGNFAATDVPFTAAAVQAFAWGIFGWVGADLATRMLWARFRYWRSLQLAAAFVAINVAFAFGLRHVGAGIGLAAARSIAFGCYFVLALVAVQREGSGFRAGRVMASLVRQTGVAIACAGLAHELFGWLGLAAAPFGQRLLAVLGAAALTRALYLGVEGLIWRSEEGQWALGFLGGRIRSAASILGTRSTR